MMKVMLRELKKIVKNKMFCLDDDSITKRFFLFAMSIYSHIWNFIINDIEYIVLNYFVAYIPLWTVRKFLYRICGMKIGKKSRIAMRALVFKPQGIEIGERNVINEFVLLDGRSGLKIGSDNSISMFAKLYSGTHDSNSDTFEYRGRCTTLCDNCWIGTSAIIMPGSKVSDFAIISANSLFKGVAVEKGIYQGVPATYIRQRNITAKYQLHYLSFYR